jgi:hypothetical protein
MHSQSSNAPDPSLKSAIAWVGSETLEELTLAARNVGVSLDQHVCELVHLRAVAQLVAPSATWLASPATASPLKLHLTKELHSVLGELCEATGHRFDVVLSNLAAGGPPVPPPELRLGFLRTEPGKGRVFGMYFEIAGFQYALMRHLAGEKLSVGRVLDSAFLALARQAATGGFLNGEPVSQAARQFAAKVLMIEGRRRS